MNDEFKALDINLDVPLREDEKLFVPSPYKQQIGLSEKEDFRLPKNSLIDKPNLLTKKSKKIKKSNKKKDKTELDGSDKR